MQQLVSISCERIKYDSTFPDCEDDASMVTSDYQVSSTKRFRHITQATIAICVPPSWFTLCERRQAFSSAQLRLKGPKVKCPRVWQAWFNLTAPQKLSTLLPLCWQCFCVCSQHLHHRFCVSSSPLREQVARVLVVRNLCRACAQKNHALADDRYSNCYLSQSPLHVSEHSAS